MSTFMLVFSIVEWFVGIALIVEDFEILGLALVVSASAVLIVSALESSAEGLNQGLNHLSQQIEFIATKLKKIQNNTYNLAKAAQGRDIDEDEDEDF